MRLIFVYNADSGVLNTVKDIGHKLFSPQTYDCFLCSLTHDTFKENPEWKTFRDSSPIEMIFLHRDEFEEKYHQQSEYPVIFKETEGLEIFISKQTLASYSSLSDLIQAVQQLESAKE